VVISAMINWRKSKKTPAQELMKDGQVLATGRPSEVITPELLLEAFALNALVIEDPVTGGPLIVPK